VSNALAVVELPTDAEKPTHTRSLSNGSSSKRWCHPWSSYCRT